MLILRIFTVMSFRPSELNIKISISLFSCEQKLINKSAIPFTVFTEQQFLLTIFNFVN